MHHTQALVRTARPSELGKRVAAEMSMEFPTEWSAEAGTIDLPDGICDMHTWPEGLRLDAFSATTVGLERIEDVVKRQLQRAGSNGHVLAVEWHRRPGSF